MASTLTNNDFRTVKAMLRAGWDRATIVDRSDRSERTVRRIARSRSFKEYRQRVAEDTASIKLRRRQKAAKGYMEDSTKRPAFHINPLSGSLVKRVLNKLGGQIWRK